ncbi:MAG: WecB/TagA/CpsF family glycosyltransferase [Defluviitaleaceae bacterium]|nr:WecB/TagA/CpsF family glycosyltransferase [Defluviitaleaceae bacterium]
MENLKKTEILGVCFDNLLPEAACERFLELAKTNEPSTVFTPNPEMVMLARKDDGFKALLNSADLLVPDGIGIVLASRLTKNRIRQRVAGIELLQNIFGDERAKKHKWYFLGGKPNVAQLAKENVEKQFEGLEVVGSRDGYFGAEDENEVIADIIASGADIVLVGLGFPRQERWINAHKDQIGAKLYMGVGGSFDVLSGQLKRAPKAFRKLGMEWLWRLLRQPSRMWRQRVLVKFAFVVLFKKIRGVL